MSMLIRSILPIASKCGSANHFSLSFLLHLAFRRLSSRQRLQTTSRRVKPQQMENEIPRSQTPHPAHSEDDTRAALREMQLAAVEREAQIARLTVHLQHALDDIERAREETSGGSAARRVEDEVRKGKGLRKNDSEEHDRSAPSSSPEQACSSTLPDSRPDPSCSPILPAHLDRDPRKASRTPGVLVYRPRRRRQKAHTPAPVSSSTPTPVVQAGRPLSIPNPCPLLLPSRPKTPSIPTPTAALTQAARAHAAVVTPISILNPTQTLQGRGLEAHREPVATPQPQPNRGKRARSSQAPATE
ncbi:hypothetical protein FB451DRAFT_1534295 [Mycena latifolia]|nr:hypothetical protein FB451DRAFT_1534295 [Mycena latifolia]